MVDSPSLFATTLRAWRASNGAHGRMTQEELAELLDVSVDAIGKYERSASFIRGDLEHRLAERLGWSREEILACREDWETRQRRAGKGPYRLLDEAAVHDVFSGSWSAAARASIDLASGELGALPREFEVNEDILLPIYETFHDHWAGVMHGDEMVAKWVLSVLTPEDETLFRTRRFTEGNLSAEQFYRPILPGTYFGYCPSLIIRPGHEAASMLLLSSFVAFLEALATREILFHGIGSVTVSPGGAHICRDLGMTHLGPHESIPGCHFWDLPGAAIPGSIFARRSNLLRQRYEEAFAP
jgi:transcriptional regulator with XRE-family HTH domain